MEITTEVKTLLDGLQTANANMLKAYEQMQSEIKVLGSASGETKTTIDKLLAEEQKLRDDLKELAQKVSGNAYGDSGRKLVKTPGELFVESQQYKRLREMGEIKSGQVEVKNLFAKDILGTPDSAGPGLPGNRRIEVFSDPKQALRIRDLIPTTTMSETSVEWVKYTFTNAAASIYDASPSPNGRMENVTKPKSDMTFTLVSDTAKTLAHWVAASKQILMDIAQLRSLIDTELRYGLKLVEEAGLLNGSGANGELNGIVTQASAYDVTLNVANDTKIDKIRHAILQARLAKYPVDAIVLHPEDWHDIETTKDGESRYLVGDPMGVLQPRLWGKPVVESDSMVAGDFLVGAFGLAARIYDREQAIVETSDSHANFFIENMIAVRCEERLLLAVTRPQAFITGSF